MSFTYTYTIISVNNEARCMEVVYESPGKTKQHIGVRLPYEGESLDNIIKIYAPIRYWEEQELAVYFPTVGSTGEITETSVPDKKTEVLLLRQKLLTASDWTQLADVPLTTEQKASWAVYRQSLRDITEQTGFPSEVVWPTAPL